MLRSLVPRKFGLAKSPITHLYYYQWLDHDERHGTGLGRELADLTLDPGRPFCVDLQFRRPRTGEEVRSVRSRGSLWMRACVVAVAACSMVLAGAPRAEAATRCRPSGATVLARSASVLVTKRRDAVTQVCYLPTRGVTRLDRKPKPFEGDPSNAIIGAVNDRYVAYSWATSGRDGGYVLLRLLDARRGRVVTAAPIYTDSDLLASNLGGLLPDVALAADGAVAWLSTLPPPDATLELRFARRGAASSTLIASSSALEVGSVALSRRYVYWRQGGVTGAFPVR